MAQETKESSEDTFLMFVYGTLKQGQPNNHHMMDPATGKASLVTPGHTVEKYPLVIAGSYNIPYLLYCPGQGHQIKGEVYRVDLQKRDFLDDFESHPTYYLRTQEDIQVPAEDGATSHLKCWVYTMRDYKPEMLNLKTYADYDSFGPHGLRYVERYNRTVSAKEDLNKIYDGKK